MRFNVCSVHRLLLASFGKRDQGQRGRLRKKAGHLQFEAGQEMVNKHQAVVAPQYSAIVALLGRLVRIAAEQRTVDTLRVRKRLAATAVPRE